MKLRAIIIDDEAAARANLNLLVREHCAYVMVVAEAKNVSEAEDLIKKFDPDLVFLDVDMPGATGFDLIERLNEQMPIVIFTTGHEKYAVKAFRVAALDFLVKPIDKEELINAVQKVIVKKETPDFGALKRLLKSDVSNPSITISASDEVHVISVEQIEMVEADRNYTVFHLADNKSITTSKPMIEVEQNLSAYRFLRVHKSFLVNLTKVSLYKKGRGGQLILKSGRVVDVSRNRKEEVLKALGV
ncbi:LytR/AlgR family response regulator transcription factor [Marinoscillum sp.]|uniref:LytR/AlgR family response regulator transcription factor n=1 Tax=Marinoscillum sp. TaxID=2024838 RepID=UPI003BAC859C